ncbi:MAG: glycosyltransferase [Lachnospiraceae bacterium]|jgi:glycosyltransferase involved in cell wall biosynthesis|nr:glycosyltransferase [Lachnospiraceae bacterium]
MLLYITDCDLNWPGYVGVRKKIMAQIEAFENVFGRVYYTIWSWQIAYLMDKDKVIQKEAAVTREDLIHVLIQWIQAYQVKHTYIRYIHANISCIKLLKYQKENNIKTVIEIPTYPYDGEIPYGRHKIEDIYYRNEIISYIDIFTTYTKDKEIWGKPCIQLNNGVSAQKLPMANHMKRNKEIVMVAVASMAPWHGYERIISGLHNYYKNGGDWKLSFKLVGEGAELKKYRELSKKYELQSYIEFTGTLEGNALTEIFNDSDIGITALGFYKTGLRNGSPIKGAEYCARGIPVICGYEDLRFSNNEFFVLHVPNDDTPIDMNEVIRFYEHLCMQKDFKEQIRDYAVKYLTWDSIMKPVIDYLQ